MYLTRVWLNPLRQQTRKLLTSPQAMKAAVWGGIPTQPVTERPLWRLDTDTPHRPALLVLTTEKPSCEHIVEQAGWPSADTPQVETQDYTPALDLLHSDRPLRFRLTANPTYKQDGKRVGHVTVQQQMGWFLYQADRHGLHIPTVGGTPQATITHRETRKFKRESHTVTLAVATFEGALTAADPDRARDAIRTGIGPARAYGCGLLTLAPA